MGSHYCHLKLDERRKIAKWLEAKMPIASLAERKTRFAVLFRDNDRSSTHCINKLMDVMDPLPQPARESITFDRGFEFHAWRKLKSGIGTESWFCDPSSSWQKGTVENTNRRARRWLPRKRDITALSTSRDIASQYPAGQWIMN